jgi:hypothetical protein
VIDVGYHHVVDLERHRRGRRAERASGRVAQPVGAARVVGVRTVRGGDAGDGAAHARRIVAVAVLSGLDQTIAAHAALERVERGACSEEREDR